MFWNLETVQVQQKKSQTETVYFRSILIHFEKFRMLLKKHEQQRNVKNFKWSWFYGFSQESTARMVRESREEIAVDFVKKSKIAQPIMIMRGKIWIFLSHHDSWARSKDNTQKLTTRKPNLFRLPMSSHRRRCRMLVGVYFFSQCLSIILLFFLALTLSRAQRMFWVCRRENTKQA